MSEVGFELGRTDSMRGDFVRAFLPHRAKSESFSLFWRPIAIHAIATSPPVGKMAGTDGTAIVVFSSRTFRTLSISELLLLRLFTRTMPTTRYAPTMYGKKFVGYAAGTGQNGPMI